MIGGSSTLNWVSILGCLEFAPLSLRRLIEVCARRPTLELSGAHLRDTKPKHQQACPAGVRQLERRDGRSRYAEESLLTTARYTHLTSHGNETPGAVLAVRTVSGASQRLLALLQVLLKMIPNPLRAALKPRPSFLCPCCGAPMIVLRRQLPPPGMDRPRCIDVGAGLIVKVNPHPGSRSGAFTRQGHARPRTGGNR